MHRALIELANEVPDAPSFERQVLELLQRQIGCDIGFFFVLGDEQSPTVLGLDAVQTERLTRRSTIYQRELLPVKQAALAGSGVAVDTQVLGERRVRRMAYFREMAAPMGGKHTLLALLTFQRRPIGGVILGRTGSDFATRDLNRLAALLPALGVARASQGLPRAAVPLPTTLRQSWLSRFRVPGGQRSLASLRIGRDLLSVRDRGGYREMIASRGTSELVWSRAHLDDPAKSGWPYIDLFHVAAALAKNRRSALFVGCGGAVALHQFARVYPGIRMDLVECEPAVIELARSWFALDSLPNLHVHLNHGADFLERASPGSWDIAIIDAYDASDVSSNLVSRHFCQCVKRALRPGGAMAFNLIASLGQDPTLQKLRESAQLEFETVRLIPVTGSDEDFSPAAPRNVVVVAVRDV